MITIISHFYRLIQLLLLIIFKLLDIIEEKKKYPPLPDDSKSFKYQKFKLDKSPIIIKPQILDYILLLEILTQVLKNILSVLDVMLPIFIYTRTMGTKDNTSVRFVISTLTY